ncbi:histidine triad nucleotide-binding protein [Caenispirillum salinarum]|uniref:histidine triad nucleotide-binding protein n=1 Tax=Caenispirillum salinarum TaxID=859058 RepID=UPI00384FA2A7
MAYDDNNVFAKILRGDIPCRKVYEDDHVLAFEDIEPKRPVHVLVIPKGKYEDATDFGENASDAEIAALHRAVARIARDSNIDGTGYRLIANTGANGGQEVPHLHFHMLGGAPAGPMIKNQ